jgi:hypothetical protein
MSANININVEENKDVFLYYENILTGIPTQEKEDFLNSEYERINNAPIELEKLTLRLKQGDISNDEYAEKVNILDELLSRKDGFNAVYNQYSTIKKSDNRYFLYANGWNPLLTSKDPKIILTLFLLIVIVPVLCYEYSSEFNNILVTTKYGREKIVLAKLIFSCIVSVSAIVLTAIIECVVCSIKYGLPMPNYPLQSLDFYATSNWDLSLLQSFFTLLVFRIFGFLLITLLILFFSVFTKKSISTLAIMSGIVFIPIFLPLQEDIKSRLPLPYGLITGVGFIKGNEFAGESLIYKALSLTEIVLLISVFTAIIIVLIYLIIKKFLNYKIRFPRKIIAVMLIPLIFFTSCNNKNISDIDFNMGIDSRYAYYNGEIFYFDIVENNFHLVRKNEQNGKVSRCILNPFLSYENSHIISIYQYKNLLYTSYFSNDSIFISEICLDNFKEKVLLEYNFETSYELLQTAENEEFHHFTLLLSGYIFANEKNIFLYSGTSIYSINKITKSFKKIQDNCMGNISFDGENIYYLNNKYQIEIYSLKSKQVNTLPEIRTNYFYLNKGKIAFLNMNILDEVGIFEIAKNKVVDTAKIPADIKFVYEDTSIFFSNLEDNQKLYRYDFSDNSSVKIADESSYEVISFYESESVYIPVIENEFSELKAYNKNG